MSLTGIQKNATKIELKKGLGNIMNDVIDIVKTETAELTAPRIKQSNFLALTGEEKIDYAYKIASKLNKVIVDCGMYTCFGRKDDPNAPKYVNIEGWNTLGALIGVKPIEVKVYEEKPGRWMAQVSLLDRSTGEILSTASAICDHNESTKQRFTPNQLRSLAITRAAGKAYRIAFSWIMSMTNFKPTPAEEMTSETILGEVDPNEITSKSTKSTRSNPTTATDVVLFQSANQEQLDKLNVQLDKRGVPAALHLDVALALEGKPFNAKSLESVIKDMPIHG